MTERIAYCAPGMEIPARFTLIREARDIYDATAEVKPHPWLDLNPGDVVVAERTVFEVTAAALVFEAPPAETRWDLLMSMRLSLISRPQPLSAIITGI